MSIIQKLITEENFTNNISTPHELFMFLTWYSRRKQYWGHLHPSKDYMLMVEAMTTENHSIW